MKLIKNRSVFQEKPTLGAITKWFTNRFFTISKTDPFRFFQSMLTACMHAAAAAAFLARDSQ
jgi:hypothetical protein